MPAVPSTPSRLAVIARLRAAGCVFAEEEARLLFGTARTAAELVDMVESRVDGRPLEHVLGWAEFCGLRIAVDPGVFVPRRRSELLVRQAVRLAGGSGSTIAGPESPLVVDLCCGSGAVGAAVLSRLGKGVLHAADIDAAAVSCARRNLPAGAHVHQGDLYDALPGVLRGRVDVLVVNAPYVPAGKIALLPAEARLHEPAVALDGGADGLDVARRVVEGAASWLATGGSVLVETSDRQAPELVAAFARTGLVPRVARSARLSATVVIAPRR